MASSRIPGFYRASVSHRRATLAESRGLDESALSGLDTGGIDIDTADGMIENVIGVFSLPLGLGLNFLIDGKDYLVPMAVEEPSVVAAASNAAKMIRLGGGFRTEVARAIMIAQVQILDVVGDIADAVDRLHNARSEILAQARALVPRLVQRGGGPVDVRVRVLDPDDVVDGADPDDPDDAADPADATPMLVVHLLVDCCDAMGANLVNTLAEKLADDLAALAGGRPGLRILSNLADERTVTVHAEVPDHALWPAAEATEQHSSADPTRLAADVRAAIVSASRFAERDPYRAATHNKGIMNGVDAVLLATGNDWRGIEAGAHAFAAQSGRYRPLAVWRDVEGTLTGTLHMPMAVATVGGSFHVHAGARLGLSILGVESSRELAAVVGCVGLACNLAALRALGTEGIQRGHMALHARMVARSAGATGALVDQVARRLASLGDVKVERARQVLARMCHTQEDVLCPSNEEPP